HPAVLGAEVREAADPLARSGGRNIGIGIDVRHGTAFRRESPLSQERHAARPPRGTPILSPPPLPHPAFPCRVPRKAAAPRFASTGITAAKLAVAFLWGCPDAGVPPSGSSPR